VPILRGLLAFGSRVVRQFTQSCGRLPAAQKTDGAKQQAEKFTVKTENKKARRKGKIKRSGAV
jgi:hypothetical protein